MNISRHEIVQLVMVCAGLLGGATAAQAIAINPSEDAFVAGHSPNSNYGSAGALGVSGSSALNGLFDSVIKFNLSSVKASFDTTYGVGLWTVQTITLKLTATAPNNPIFNAQSAGSFSVVWMQNDGWTGGTGTPAAPAVSGINYTTLPSFLGVNDQALGTYTFNPTTTPDGTSATYSLGLSSGLLADIQNGSSASFELLAASSGVSFLFNSVNNGMVANRPLLTITATPVPEPAEWCAIAAGCVLLVGFRMRRRRHAR